TDTFGFFPKQIPRFITDEKLIEIFGQLGAIFILLKVGLHVKFRSIFNVNNSIVAFFGVVIPFAAGYLYSEMTGEGIIYGMFLGAALAATSVGITVALLKEYNLIKTRVAEVVLGAAIIDDVLGLLVLSFVTIFAAGGGMNLNAIAPTILNTIVFLAGGVIIGNYFVRNVIDKDEFDSKTLLIALSFAFVYAYIAEYIGLSSIVGAFLAGIILNGSRHLKKIDEQTHGIELVFAPIFFISLGMLVEVSALAEFIVPILIITALAIASKFIGCGIGGIMIKLKPIENLIVGAGMTPRGEVALIVGLIGITKGVIDSEQYTVIAAMSFLTAFLMPFIIQPLLKKFEKESA
ncbi:cation:proton antiporter, partial [Candidatus Micrarchaeota archaeon]|nr:cation:proton antiporter [Candidatus Micrarchaeota archaeon]